MKHGGQVGYHPGKNPLTFGTSWSDGGAVNTLTFWPITFDQHSFYVVSY